MKNRLIRSIFWTIVAVFVAIVCMMFVLPVREWLMPYGFYTMISVFLILGVTLIVLTVKKKVTGILKRLLLLTGASAVGLPVFAILHNLITALLNYFFDFGADFDEPVFFILAIIVCPLGFLLGAVGLIILGFKNKLKAEQAIGGR